MYMMWDCINNTSFSPKNTFKVFPLTQLLCKLPRSLTFWVEVCCKAMQGCLLTSSDTVVLFIDGAGVSGSLGYRAWWEEVGCEWWREKCQLNCQVVSTSPKMSYYFYTSGIYETKLMQLFPIIILKILWVQFFRFRVSKRS